jgi:hypothetical protein
MKEHGISDEVAMIAALALRPEDVTRRNRKRLSGPGMRTFVRIAAEWALSTDEQARMLAAESADTYSDWVNKANSRRDLVLPVTALARISAVLGIYRALYVLFDDRQTRLAWLESPHDAPWCRGQIPKAVLMTGDLGLMLAVRNHLDQLLG